MGQFVGCFDACDLRHHFSSLRQEIVQVNVSGRATLSCRRDDILSGAVGMIRTDTTLLTTLNYKIGSIVNLWIRISGSS